MLTFAQKLALFSLLFTLSFVLVSVFNANYARAGWTCCVPNPDGSASSDCGKGGSSTCPNGCCSTQTKSRNECSGQEPGGCINCGGNYVSNACGSGGGSSLCQQPTHTPSTIPLKIGQSRVLKTYTFAGGPIGRLDVVSSNTAVATTTPSSRNLCCGWTYGGRTYETTITAVSEGTAIIRSTFFGQSPDTRSCFVESPVTVSGSAILQCIPGASCRPTTTDSFSPYANVICSMPAVTDESLLMQYGTKATYYMECTPYKGTTAQKKISKTSTNGVFGTFAIEAGITNIKCAFRYCLTNTKNLVTTCSEWGKAS